MVYRPRVCLDSSVAVKWFRIEENRKGAFELRELAEAKRIKLVFSAIVLTESARGLKKAGYSDDKIYEMADMLDSFISLCGVDVAPVDRLIIKLAQKLVIQHNLFSADAIHAATAILSDSDFFVSGDEHHFKESLKSHFEDKNVRILRLSEVKEISL